MTVKGERYTFVWDCAYCYATITRNADGVEIAFLQGDEAAELLDDALIVAVDLRDYLFGQFDL